MTVETETILIKFLEELKAEVKETRLSLESQNKETSQKLDKFIETTNENLTKIQISLATQGEQIKALQKGQDAVNSKLDKQSTWQLSLITGLVLGVLALVTTIGKIVFFPANP